MSADAEKARYVMVGGFLGAGKTTAVGALARWLTDRGLRCGLIANDQSDGLVDTRLLRSQGHTVEEIAGGCFCCRFDSLNEAAARLTRETRPEVIVAEPVGSCTDLVATVSYPLRRIYGDRFEVAPLSVLVDPRRAARILGLEKGPSFSDKVRYVYLKQLEEADLIVVNKCDRLDDVARERLRGALRERFPKTEVLTCSAREGEGLEAWFERLLSGSAAERATMELDYDVYAEGEARLGWLNSTLRLTAPEGVDGNRLLLELAEAVEGRLRDAALEVAHLKMTLDSPDAGGLSVVSIVATGDEPDLRESLLDTIRSGGLIVNLRAEAEPEKLEAYLREGLTAAQAAHPGLGLEVEHSEHFRPARPVPTHRISRA